MARDTPVLQPPARYSAASQPGTAEHKMRLWAQRGAGELGAMQLELQRMQRTREEGSREPPRVDSVGDITRGLGLVNTDAQALERLIAETRTDFAVDPKLRSQTYHLALERLGDYLQKTKRIDSDQRMEIRRRCAEYWRKFGRTHYEGKPVARFIFPKAQLQSPTLLKAGSDGRPSGRYATAVEARAAYNRELEPEQVSAARARAAYHRKPGGKPGGGKGGSSGSGGPYIGPRGGKWADPEHTKPYQISEYKLSVSGPGAQDLGEQIKAGIGKASDLCKISPPVCHGNLGIPRDKMPQLGADVVPKFLESLQADGIKVTKEREHVGKLKATQGEINAEKVLGMVEAKKSGKFDPGKEPIIVSKDGYVLDGHHRWAAEVVYDPAEEMNVYRVQDDIRDLLKRANGFEGVKQAGFSAPSDMSAVKKALVLEAVAASIVDDYLRGMDEILRKSEGPYIGPRGGKWADPAHTVPWHDIDLAIRDSTVRGMQGFVRHKVTAHARYGDWAAHAPEPIQDAAAMALPNKIEGYELEGPRKLIGAGMFAQKAANHSYGWLKFVPKSGGITQADKPGEYYVTSHKTAKAAGVEPETHVVTHVPTGFSVKRGLTKQEAVALARHLHEHAGTLAGEFGKPSSSKEELKRVKVAIDAFDEQQHQKALVKPPPKPRKRSKRDQEAFDRMAAWDASRKAIEAEAAGWDEPTKAAEKAAEESILSTLRRNSQSGVVMRTAADGTKHVIDLNRTLPKAGSGWERESQDVASGRTWREVLANMPKTA